MITIKKSGRLFYQYNCSTDTVKHVASDFIVKLNPKLSQTAVLLCKVSTLEHNLM